MKTEVKAHKRKLKSGRWVSVKKHLRRLVRRPIIMRSDLEKETFIEANLLNKKLIFHSNYGNIPKGVYYVNGVWDSILFLQKQPQTAYNFNHNQPTWKIHIQTIINKKALRVPVSIKRDEFSKKTPSTWSVFSPNETKDTTLIGVWDNTTREGIIEVMVEGEGISFNKRVSESDKRKLRHHMGMITETLDFYHSQYLAENINIRISNQDIRVIQINYTELRKIIDKYPKIFRGIIPNLIGLEKFTRIKRG